jgi:deoxycytidine triphosphate deaminase
MNTKRECGISDRKLRRDAEIARLRQLWDRQPKTEQEFTFHGVLLSDAIEECVANFGLITPFDPNNLKPASYKLTIGDEYAIDGKITSLVDEPGKNRITIPPFAVAIVKTHETVNMPRFLIGRWNIQVSRAYEGLVWVGGPQVDPGYVGYLFCPIYNLGDKPVELTMGKPIAVIDFVRTSQVQTSSRKYKFPPDNVLFEDYKPETLISGIAKTYKEVIQKTDAAERQLGQISTKIDNFVLIMFTVIAVLFAAVTIFVTRADQASLWNPALFLISITAVFISGAAWMRADFRGRVFGIVVQIAVVLFLMLAIAFHIWDTRPIQQQVNQLRKDLEELKKQNMPTPKTDVLPAAGAVTIEEKPRQGAPVPDKKDRK